MLMLMAVVSFFRAPRDLIFWAAIAFFAAHTAMTLRRYLRERRVRTTATVIRHHQAHPTPATVVFLPSPVSSLISLEKLPKQTKNLL